MTALLSSRMIRAGPSGLTRAMTSKKSVEGLTRDVPIGGGGFCRVRAGPELTDIGLDLAEGSELLS